MILRCTKKLRDRLPDAPQSGPSIAPGLLGDWHASLLITKPSWLVLLVNDLSRLPVFLPAREFSTLLERIPTAVGDVLAALEVDEAAIAREREVLRRIMVAPTTSRSVLGTMNDFVFQLEWIRGHNPDLAPMEWSLRLAETPVGPMRYEYPADAVRRLLVAETVR